MTKVISIIRRHTGVSPESSQCFGFVSDCSDRHSLFNQKFTEMQSGKDNQRKRYKFTITDTEVTYWKKIHDLNTTSIERKQNPFHVAEYLLQFDELMEAKG